LAVALLAVLLAGSWGLSRALEGGWARRALLSRLSAGFGRPVEVGRFGFSLLSGLRLEAQSVTVYDDPRFGHEYFLRAEQLTASVRWLALLGGRFEFDTVFLTRPSLNLVRLADGQWNIESWLPPLPAGKSARGSGAAAESTASSLAAAGGVATAAARLSRVEVEGGRINFKRDSRKLPLALVGVEGRFDHDAAGHWNIDVQANPLRAPASLQQAGVLRVRGAVGGVSTRLRPASLALSWEDASLADLSRLVQGRDGGIRGTFDADLTARIEDSPSAASSWGEWAVEGKLRLEGVHDWALAGRATDPGANVIFQAAWRPSEYRLLVTRWLVEAPQSRMEGAADFDWSRRFYPQARITSSYVALSDLLSWRRAFRAGIADDLVIEGALDARATLSGWPLRVEDLSFASAGATIRAAALPGPIRVGPIATGWNGGTLKLRPTSISLPVAAPVGMPARGRAVPELPPSPSSLLVEAAIGPLPTLNEWADSRFRFSVSGSARRAQDLLAVARAWNGSAEPSWTAEGPVSLRLAWSGRLRSRSSAPGGTIQASDVQLTSALLNRPLLVSAATIDLRGDQRRINFQSVEALGARWTGSLKAPTESGAWEFDLSADRLDTADLYDWLGAPVRPTILQRILPFGLAAQSGDPAQRAGALEALQARGRLRVAELYLAPLQVETIDAVTIIEGGKLVARQGRANLLGGRIAGTFEATLSPEPSYVFDGQFSRLNLHDAAALAALPGRAGGLASGELKLAARGVDRASLLASLQGQGLLRASDAWLEQIEPAPGELAAAATESAAAETRPFALTAPFQISDRRILLDQAILSRSGEETEITGAIDFARRLDLRARFAPGALAATIGSAALRDSWTVVGTLDAPRLTSAPAPTPPIATTTPVPAAAARR
jgi:hypothetical protein